MGDQHGMPTGESQDETLMPAAAGIVRQNGRDLALAAHGAVFSLVAKRRAEGVVATGRLRARRRIQNRREAFGAQAQRDHERDQESVFLHRRSRVSGRRPLL